MAWRGGWGCRLREERARRRRAPGAAPAAEGGKERGRVAVRGRAAVSPALCPGRGAPAGTVGRSGCQPAGAPTSRCPKKQRRNLSLVFSMSCHSDLRYERG